MTAQNSNRPTRKPWLLFAGWTLISLTGCMTSEDKGPTPVVDKGMIFAITSDYKTGSYAAYGLDSSFVAKDIAPIFSDAVVRFAGGNDILILNRMGRDNMQVVDRHNLKTVLQFNFPPLSNPYDVAVKDSLYYVGFYAYAKIGVYRQRDGEKQDEIDISTYADSSDHLPETTELLILGDQLYAVLANLDTKNKFAPLQAKLLRIDLKTKGIQSLDLPFGNPVSMTYDSAANKLFIPCIGRFFNSDFTLDLDGAIVGVNLTSFSVSDTVATEKSLGGSLNKVALYQGKLYMDLTAPDSSNTVEKVLAINVADGKSSILAQTDGYGIGGLVIDDKTGTLFVGDRTLGLRIFDISTGLEKSGSKVNLGLPISELTVVR